MLRREPTRPLTELSEAARALHDEVARRDRYARDRLDLSGPDRWAAAGELADAGHGTVYDSAHPEYRAFHLARLHPAFSEAFGGTGWTVEVAVHDRAHPERDGQVLLRGVGATVEDLDRTADRHLPRQRIRIRHGSATDFEHDACHLADLEIEHPGGHAFHPDGTVRLWATLVSIRAYATLDAPVSDAESSGTCTRCDPPHPVRAYQPPERDDLVGLAGRLVHIALQR